MVLDVTASARVGWFANLAEPMVAVCAAVPNIPLGALILGVFPIRGNDWARLGVPNPDTYPPHGMIPIGAIASLGTASLTTAFSPDGEIVYVAAASSEGATIYRLDNNAGSGWQLGDPLPFAAADGVAPFPVSRFAATSDGIVFASCTLDFEGAVLRRDGPGNWTVVFQTDPSVRRSVPSLCADDTGLLFVAMSDGVYAYENRSGTWLWAGAGLPDDPRSREIRFVSSIEPEPGRWPSARRRYLYLGTWGRSLWRAAY